MDLTPEEQQLIEIVQRIIATVEKAGAQVRWLHNEILILQELDKQDPSGHNPAHYTPKLQEALAELDTIDAEIDYLGFIEGLESSAFSFGGDEEFTVPEWIEYVREQSVAMREQFVNLRNQYTTPDAN